MNLTIWILPLKPTEWGFVQKKGVSSTWISMWNHSRPQHSMFESGRTCRRILAGNNYCPISFSGTRAVLSEILLTDPKTFSWIPEPTGTQGNDQTNKKNCTKKKKQHCSKRDACFLFVLKWDKNNVPTILVSQESHAFRPGWEDRLVI